MKVVALAGNGLRRLVRDRSSIFFVFILPLAIIVLVGAQFGAGGGGARLAVSHAAGPVASAITESLAQEGISVVEVADEAAVADRVERAAAVAGLVIPAGFDEALGRGEAAEVGLVTRPDSGGSLQGVVYGAVSDATAEHRVARALSVAGVASFPEALALVGPIEAAGVEVTTRTVGEAVFGADVGQFSVGAAQQLVLFVFLTALTGSAALIQGRQLGVTRRMLATPTTARVIVVGEGAGRFAVGLFQGLYILVVTMVAFGVEWGDPWGWAPLLVAFAATGAGAAMLVGSLFRNDQQAGGFSVMAGLALAALGGCMLPLELFSPTMYRIAHLTPHAWAVDGFAELVYRGGSLDDVIGEIAVLFGYAAVLLALAGWRLRRVITAG